jgi:hypothetical protein
MTRSTTLVVLLFALRTAQCAVCTAWERLPVKLFNDAAVGNEVLHRAKEEAAWLLKSICVDVAWVPCPVVARSNLRPCEAPVGALELHILSSPGTNDFGENILGIAMPHLGSGDHAGVFLSRVRQKAAQNVGLIDLPELLGCVMAHEIGHLLLHSNVHSSEGLMRTEFRRADLKKAAQRQLKFSSEEGEAIHRNALAQER